jgi:transcriptional regulator
VENLSLKETKRKVLADPAMAARIRSEVVKAHHSVTLADLRAGLVTQQEVAQALGVSWRRVSAIESASDFHVSTLRSYVGTVGYTLELIAKSETGERIAIDIE